MRTLLSGLRSFTELFLLTILLMVGGGMGEALAQGFTNPGGGSGGFTGRPLITVELYVNDTETNESVTSTRVPVNLAGIGANPSLPYTRTLTAVLKQDGRLLAGNIQLDLAPTLASGVLLEPEDPTEGFRSLSLESSGISTAFFLASATPGTVVITASAQDPVTQQRVSASIEIEVYNEERPPSSITFGGPFVNAVLAGESRFGDPPILDGTYSRVVSVVVNDANGNPTNPNTQINFFLIDGPLNGYPNHPGSFHIAGNNGDPVEGLTRFRAVNGGFRTKGVLLFDWLMLDGRLLDTSGFNNSYHTGLWRVQSVPREQVLTVQQPFNVGKNNRGTVPYIIGRAQNGAVLSPSFTNLNGVASTTLTYPVERLGQTAVLMACTTDMEVCGILNTCDSNGANCGSVYLGATDGTDRVLTVSATSLGPNRSTDVRMCLRDVNFSPLPATEIRYDVGARGPATVTVNGVADIQGAFFTGQDGCTTVTIASSGQIPGSQEIPLQFTSNNVATPADLTIRSPGAGKIDGFFDCQFTPELGTGACTGTLRLTDDEGSPMSEVLIAVGNIEAAGRFSLSFDPAEGEFGKTDDQGEVQVAVSMERPGDYVFPFQTASGGTATFTLNVTVPAPGTLEITLDPTEAELGTFYSGALAVTGGVPPYEFSLKGVLPPGLSLNTSTGIISGTPTSEGTFSFVVDVKEIRPEGDSSALTGTAAFTITVGEGEALTVSLEPTAGAVGVPFNGVTSAEGGTAPYTFSLVAGSLPSGVSLSSSGTLSGTPTAVGDFAVSIQATDSNGATGTGNFTITISSESPVTVTLEGGGAGVVGTPFTDGVLTAAGGAPPYTFRDASGGLAATGLSVGASTGAITGTPSQAGAITFTAEATDSNGVTGTGAVTLTITEEGGGTGDPLTITLNTPLPTATAGVPYSTVIGTATGGTSPYIWSFESKGNLPADITLSSSGVLEGTFGAAGTYDFVVNVADSSTPQLTSIANATITVETDGGSGPIPTLLTLLSSSPELPSSDQTPVMLTAVARDANSVLVEGATVNFQVKSGDGTLQVINATTDETGKATAELSAGGNKRNRDIVIGASSGGIESQDVTVAVTGTRLNVSGVPAAIQVGSSVPLTFTLIDSSDRGIGGAQIAVVVTGAVTRTETLTTNAAGVALDAQGNPFTLDVTASGTYTIDATWDGLATNANTSTLPVILTASPDSFVIEILDLVTQEPLTSAPLDTPVEVRVTWTKDSQPVPGASIRLTTTKGMLNPSEAGSNGTLYVGVTNASGQTSDQVTLQSSVPGSATLSATGTLGADIVNANASLQFFASVPDRIVDLQANPTNIGVNIPPSTAERSTITAFVVDVNGNPVAAQEVVFAVLQDTSGGALTASSASTDLSGRATVEYEAGSSATQENGVIIQAAIPGTTLTRQVTLTVSDKEIFITLGTGNEIFEPTPTQYSLPYNVLVNDIVGGAVAGTDVVLDIVPKTYHKGQYRLAVSQWVPETTIVCPSEDLGQYQAGVFVPYLDGDIRRNNGILDPGEDNNGNGRLDPGNVATTSVPSVVTDNSGFGFFDVLYAQQFASWIDVDLLASTRVSGTEAQQVSSFNLPASAADLTNIQASPPGQPSPFGVLPSCAISNQDERQVTLSSSPSPDQQLNLSVGGAALGVLQTVSDTVTVTVSLPGTDPSVLGGTAVFATAAVADSRLEMQVDPRQVRTTGADALFTVRVTNPSTTQSVPVGAVLPVGTVTFEVGVASIVLQVNLTP